MNENEDYWFEPKQYGIGAGLPVRWQGWLALALYIAVIVLAAQFLNPQDDLAFIAILVLATAALLIITARKTRGGWRWRWGED